MTLLTLLPSAGPVVVQRGVAVVADIEVSAFFHDDLEELCIYGELTEHCWSDSGGVYVPIKQKVQNDGQAKPKVLTNGKAKRRERTKAKRSRERALVQKELGTDLKINVLMKYSANPTTVAIRTGFDAVHSQVTVAGWVGLSPRSLPSRVFTLQELTEVFKLRLIRWNGRYGALTLLLAQVLPAF